MPLQDVARTIHPRACYREERPQYAPPGRCLRNHKAYSVLHCLYYTHRTIALSPSLSVSLSLELKYYFITCFKYSAKSCWTVIELTYTMMNITENVSSPAVFIDFVPLYLPLIHFVMLWAMFILSIPGLILNLTICALTFHPVVNGEYKWFIFNLSMIDSIYSISNLVHSQWMLFHSDYDGILCKISCMVHWYCVLVTLMALFPISFNRICSLRYQNL
jgi:hypothetical protein